MLSLLLALGCRDSGLPGRNTPAETARNQAWRYPLYEQADPLTDRAAVVFLMAGQPWLSTGTQESIPATLLKPVATTQGIEIFALRWDDAPYTRLYIAGRDGRWRPLARGS